MLTREQVAKILRNMVSLLGVKDTNKDGIRFKDEDRFSNWAKEQSCLTVYRLLKYIE